MLLFALGKQIKDRARAVTAVVEGRKGISVHLLMGVLKILCGGIVLVT